MATKTKVKTTKKNDKDGLKSIIISGFFVIVFVCAFFGMDVKKNTPIQFIDKVLSGNIVETAEGKAKDLRNVISQLQSLQGNLVDVSLAPSSFTDLEKITENLSKLDEINKSIDNLMDRETLSFFVNSEDKSVMNLMNAERKYIGAAHTFYTFLSYNQSYLGHDANGAVQVDSAVYNQFQRLLTGWVEAQDNLRAMENLFK